METSCACKSMETSDPHVKSMETFCTCKSMETSKAWNPMGEKTKIALTQPNFIVPQNKLTCICKAKDMILV